MEKGMTNLQKNQISTEEMDHQNETTNTSSKRNSDSKETRVFGVSLSLAVVHLNIFLYALCFWIQVNVMPVCSFAYRYRPFFLSSSLRFLASRHHRPLSLETTSLCL